MRRQNRTFVLLVLGVLFSITLTAQNRPVDKLKVTDRFGFTTMSYFTFRNWVSGDKNTKGSLRFDSFRIWAKSDVDKRFFGAVQYRFYEGWNMPLHMYVGVNIDDNNTLQLGQTWVPFGIGYQPFDDWGNIAFYVGLQDDYDYGIVWTGKFNIVELHAAFFKNQQLSSESSFRYDTDIYSGDVSSDNLFSVSKKNKEINQFNLRLAVNPSFNNWKLGFGVSGMMGQIYNISVDDNGNRFAAALHASLNVGVFHFNAQGTWYNYTQALPDTATPDMKDFINVSSWAFAYEIPVSANIFTSSAAIDIIDEKLTVHANYSYLWGGTSQAESQLFTAGVRTLWDSFEVFAEAYYGVNDPQLSGKATGYGRDANSYDFRFDVRFFYKLKIVSEDTIERLMKKRHKDTDK